MREDAGSRDAFRSGADSVSVRDGTVAPLRILVVHNRYQVRGGEDAVVEQEVASLRRAGQSVETLFLDNDGIRTAADKLRAAWEAAYAPRGIAAVLDAVRAFRPDVVHAHNVFPRISPGMHAAVRATGTATVQTLHNFRVTCANGILMRDARPCEDCVGGSPYQAVRHACYRGSRLGSLAVARMIDVHRRAGTWTRDVDRFIALTDFARSRFVAAGLPGDRIRIKPNGLADPGAGPDGPRAGILYVGRLGPEKGVAPLVEAAGRTRAPLTIIGDGPLVDLVRGVPNLTYLGPRDREGVRAAMRAAQAVVVPSLCYEGLPMVIAEAFSVGTPVIVSRIGALPDLVGEGVTGLHAAPGDPDALARAFDRIIDAPEEARAMGRAGRGVYEREWTEASVTARALPIYREAIAARASSHQREAP
ncbi:glycosyltransferase family 4 protein [Methylobacterium sp. J-078]|uniref:glycosyltransferase family 4 protein n=1 Tax=Methylobacterium sp. J-078 TaxID=2836657 RepID=UPI001FB8F293|nr:glycosyltransferase family 4 protein [Methylobacterium sp. J-078]MCJ2044183.1 glycosyltransferase family 4 protein [Methylobacterium sp. J-078]